MMAVEAAEPTVEVAAEPRRRSLLRRIVRQPGGAFGLAVLVLLILVAIFADVIAPYSPTKIGAGPRFADPFGAYLLGTDDLGRDLFSRIVHGARLTVLVAGVAVFISMSIGVLIGLVAAYARGIVEMLLMRTADVIFSFTETLIALACVAILGPSLENAVIAVGIAGIPYYARTTYAAALVETGKPYFEGAAASGAGVFRLIFVHLLPNVLPTIIVVATLGVSMAILAAAALSFLGLGAQPPDPEWGKMLSDARDFFNRAPWLMFVPGACIAITVMAFNLLGDALREALDPRARR